MRFIAALIVSVVVFVSCEATWLTVMRPFYTRMFAQFATGPLALESLTAAAATYLFLLLGAYFFVALPIAASLEAVPGGLSAKGTLFHNIVLAKLRGAAFGAVVYGVYNLTNKSLLKGYPWSMVFVDTAWGATLFAAMAAFFTLAYITL